MGKSTAETRSAKRKISPLNQRRQLYLLILAIVVVFAAVVLFVFPDKRYRLENPAVVIDLKQVKKEAKQKVVAAVSANVGLGSGLGENVGWSKDILRSGIAYPSTPNFI
jgi:hypothetical protein